MKYVDICLAKDHLRVTHDDDDISINAKIEQASSMVKSYIKGASPYEPFRDSNDDPELDSDGNFVNADPIAGKKTIRYEVQAATLLLVQLMYDGTLHERYSPSQPHNFLPPEVAAILYPLRTPTFA